MNATKATPRSCSDCGVAHFGRVPCGMSWLERLKSVKPDASAQPTRTRRRYFDSQAVAQMVGEGSRERYMDATKGLGAVVKDDRGELRYAMNGERANPDIFATSPIVDER